MGWKATGQASVRQQRGKWVVRLDGIDTESGKHRPRQLGTHSSERAASAAAKQSIAEGQPGPARATVGWVVHRWVASRTDVGPKSRLQYEWAAGHIDKGLGSIRLDRLDREDVARWLDGLASGGEYARRSIIIFRTVLRAALADAVEEGLLRRSPAARVPMPKVVAKPEREREVPAWDEGQVDTFLEAIEGHRWAAPLRLAVLYGLRRSELLGLRWKGVNLDRRTVTIDAGVVEVRGRPVWTEGKNARSRRTFRHRWRHWIAPRRAPCAAASGAAGRRFGLEGPRAGGGHRDRERGVAGQLRPDPRSDRDARRSASLDLARATPHRGHPHGVREAADVGELRAAADVLGHSPDVLLKTYAHVLPDSMAAVAERIGNRRRSSGTS
jgi:integrase